MREFELETREDARGRNQLAFGTVFFSDAHLLTKQCKAKNLIRFIDNVAADRIVMVGDMIDLWHANEQKQWDVDPWHRQFVGHILRHPAAEKIYIPGNHDEVLRAFCGKTIGGVQILYDMDYETKKGENFFVCHGDVFDNKLRNEKQQGAYQVGDYALERLYDLSEWLNKVLDHEEISLPGVLSKSFAGVAEKESQVKANSMRFAKEAGYDGVICGHSHIPEISEQDGIMYVNEGSSTTHGAQFFAEDKHGTKALITVRKNKGLKIETEYGGVQRYSWQELGMPHVSETPEIIEDEFTQAADRIMDMVSRLVPKVDAVKNHQVREQQNGYQSLGL